MSLVSKYAPPCDICGAPSFAALSWGIRCYAHLSPELRSANPNANRSLPSGLSEQKADAGLSPFRSFRADGWPLCPCCGEDELWSCGDGLPSAEPGPGPERLAQMVSNIAGCYRCGWEPPTDGTYLARSVTLDLSQVTPAAYEASFELYRRGAR